MPGDPAKEAHISQQLQRESLTLLQKLRTSVVSNHKSETARRQQKKNNSTFKGGSFRGQRGESSKNAVLRGKRHDNTISKVQL